MATLFPPLFILIVAVVAVVILVMLPIGFAVRIVLAISRLVQGKELFPKEERGLIVPIPGRRAAKAKKAEIAQEKARRAELVLQLTGDSSTEDWDRQLAELAAEGILEVWRIDPARELNVYTLDVLSKTFGPAAPYAPGEGLSSRLARRKRILVAPMPAAG